MGKKGDKSTSIGNEKTEALLEKLKLITGVTSKKMFGGHGIFCDKKMFGMIDSKGNAFLKVDESNQANFEAKGSTRHSRMPYFTIPEAIMNDQDQLLEWAGQSIEIALKKK